MPDKKEVKRLMSYAKKILDKKTLHKLKKIRQEDKIEVIHYAIKSKLDHYYGELVYKKDKMKKQGKDIFAAETKLDLLNSKTKLFIATYHKKDFVVMRHLFKQVEGELGNV